MVDISRKKKIASARGARSSCFEMSGAAWKARGERCPRCGMSEVLLLGHSPCFEVTEVPFDVSGVRGHRASR